MKNWGKVIALLIVIAFSDGPDFIAGGRDVNGRLFSVHYYVVSGRRRGSLDCRKAIFVIKGIRFVSNVDLEEPRQRHEVVKWELFSGLFSKVGWYQKWNSAVAWRLSCWKRRMNGHASQHSQPLACEYPYLLFRTSPSREHKFLAIFSVDKVKVVLQSAQAHLAAPPPFLKWQTPWEPDW